MNESHLTALGIFGSMGLMKRFTDLLYAVAGEGDREDFVLGSFSVPKES